LNSVLKGVKSNFRTEFEICGDWENKNISSPMLKKLNKI
jgi:hypothetical protein